MAYRTALFKMHIVAVLFGITGVFGKLIASSAFVLVFGRALFALLAISLLALKMRRLPWHQLSAKRIGALCCAGLLLAAHWVTFFIAVKVGGIAVGTLGFASFPAFVALFEWLFLREKLSVIDFLLMILVTLGLVLVTPSFDFADSATEGLLWGTLSGLVYALLAIANRQAAAKISGVQVCWWQNLSVMLCMLPFAAGSLSGVSLTDWFWIACLGLICTGLAYSLFIDSLMVLKARVAALIIALEPIYAIFVAWLLFSETPSLRMVLGGALIIFTVSWVGMRKVT